MSILLDSPRSAPGRPRGAAPTAPGGGLAHAGPEGRLLVGIVNNMPDSALQATERQFQRLIGEAAAGLDVRVRFYALPGVERGPEAAARIAAHYGDVAALEAERPDALVVTGCEPRAASLAAEPFWPGLSALVGWAERHTVSTLWSCLAAHAAVLAADGIGRRRLPAKRSGVYDCAALADHPLLSGTASRLEVPHSRWNDLPEAELKGAGYSVLTRSAEAGVDLFVRERGSLFVFFQGHPEYDADSLLREYRRDIARYLRGERPDYPDMPHRYFDPAAEDAFAAVRRLALADRRAVGLRDLPREPRLRPALAADWGGSVRPVFRNWLALVAARAPAG